MPGTGFRSNSGNPDRACPKRYNYPQRTCITFPVALYNIINYNIIICMYVFMLQRLHVVILQRIYYIFKNKMYISYYSSACGMYIIYILYKFLLRSSIKNYVCIHVRHTTTICRKYIKIII